jgi:hypothetical protein
MRANSIYFHILLAVMALSACTAQRRTVSSSSGSGGFSSNSLTQGPVTCRVGVNPAPALLVVGTDGEILSGNRNVSIGLDLSRPAKVTSVIVDRPSGYQLPASFSVPSDLQSQFSIAGQLLDGRENGVSITVMDSSSNTTVCPKATLSVVSTVQPTRPVNPISAPLTGRFNGDALIDSLVLETVVGYIWVTLGGATAPQNWGNFSPAVNWRHFSALDSNADGLTDVTANDPTTGNWWVARSNGNSFTNYYVGTWSPNAAWTDVTFGTGANGIPVVFGTDGNGVRWSLALNGSPTNPSSPQFLPPERSISVAAAPGTSGSTALSVAFNSKVYVSWTASNARDCFAYTGPDNQAVPIGSGPVASNLELGPLTASTRVSLRCNNAVGEAIAPVSAQVTVGSAPPGILSLTSSAPAVDPGGRVSLVFSSQNATSCNLRQGDTVLSQALNGTISSLDIHAPVDFLLSCAHSSGPLTARVSVKLTALITFSPPTMQFSSVNTGATSAAQNLVLTSNRNSSQGVVFNVPAGFIVGAGTCGAAGSINLAQGASCSVPVQFRPTVAGVQNGRSLTVTYDNGRGATLRFTSAAVLLSGTGTTPPAGGK